MEYPAPRPGKKSNALHGNGSLSTNGTNDPPASGEEEEARSAQEEERQLRAAVRRLNSRVLGLTLGLLGGLFLFAATLWLVLKGGETVGPHLALLSQFFPGYQVTFWGSFVGLFYGLVVGFCAGWLVAWVYNVVVDIRNE